MPVVEQGIKKNFAVSTREGAKKVVPQTAKSGTEA